MKQFITSRILVFKIALVVIGVIMAVFTFKDAVAIWKNDIGKIYQKGIDDYEEGELVSGKIEYVLGAVATLESTQTVYGIPVSKERTPYYLCVVPYNEKTDTEAYLLLVHATDKDTINNMEKLIYHTEFTLENPDMEITSSTEPCRIEGKTAVIPDDVMNYALEYLGDEYKSKDDLDGTMPIYMLNEMNYSIARFYPLFGVLLAAAPIVLHMINKRRAHAYKSKRIPGTEQYNAPDFNSAPVDRDGNIAAPVRRYSSDSYAAHTRYRGQTGEETSDYREGEMDSIDTTNLRL